MAERTDSVVPVADCAWDTTESLHLAEVLKEETASTVSATVTTSEEFVSVVPQSEQNDLSQESQSVTQDSAANVSITPNHSENEDVTDESRSMDKVLETSESANDESHSDSVVPEIQEDADDISSDEDDTESSGHSSATCDCHLYDYLVPLYYVEE